ncbi:hypothetical protein [Candidatus Formimonas warabiya]|uniref:Uncharacterized protein n=1 Tax=Formimonas warabiya TaxID=1761012 RepID=A0A3G1KVG5_FORW1|nr:hypothetical protein [Candidatus Formimonas warabiya]ATW26397.1 hypothetical protein DCMF_17995 [Candidatus Formimonas warabiya]
MKGTLENLLISFIFIVLIALFLKGIPDQAYYSGAAVCAGIILELPDFYRHIKSRKGVGFDGQIFLGQGIPALLLFTNLTWSKWVIELGIPAGCLSWLNNFAQEFQLIGALWTGVMIVKTVKAESKMFHVKHRRKKTF